MPAVAAVIVAETLTASLVFAAVAQVGLALTVVGAVTGNQTLMKVGGVLGLVGGVGGLVNGLANGAAGAAAGNLGGELGAEAASSGLNELGYIGSDIAQAAPVDGLAGSLAEGAGSAIDAAPVNFSGDGLADYSAGMADSGTQQLGAIGDTPSIAQQTFPEVGAPTGASAPAELAAPSAPSTPGAAPVGGYQSPTNPLGAVKPDSGGWLSEIIGNKDNRGLLMEGAKLVGGGLQGAEKTRLAEEELKARMGVHEYNKMLAERQQANANAQPNLSKLRYTPNPGLFTNKQQPVKQFSGLMKA